MGKVLVIKGADFSNVAVKIVELKYTGPTITSIYNAGDCTVTLICQGATNIYYTVDGSTPTTSSTLYQGAFVLHSTGIVTVKAIATFSNGNTSDVSIKKIDYINTLLLDSLKNNYYYDNSSKKYKTSAGSSLARGTLSFGLTNGILNNVSHISVSVNSSFKISRQYWTGLAESWDAARDGQGLGTLISDSSSWESQFEEDIPSNANGIGFVINGDCSDPTAIGLNVVLT